MVEHVPAPMDVNPDPKAGDRWFNYRSMQYVMIELINPNAPQGGRAMIRGEGSGRTVSVLLTHLKNPRFFRFISSAQVPGVKPAAPAPETAPTAHVLGQVLDELRTLNRRLDALVTAKG